MKSNAIKGVQQDYSVAKKQVATKFAQAKAKMTKLEQDAEDYISENPKRATAIAIGVGAVVGAAITAFWLKEKKKASAKSAK